MHFWIVGGLLVADVRLIVFLRLTLYRTVSYLQQRQVVAPFLKCAGFPQGWGVDDGLLGISFHVY